MVGGIGLLGSSRCKEDVGDLMGVDESRIATASEWRVMRVVDVSWVLDVHADDVLLCESVRTVRLMR